MICKIPSHLNHSMIKTFKCMLQALAQFERQWSLSLHSLAADSVTKETQVMYVLAKMFHLVQEDRKTLLRKRHSYKHE